MAFLGCGAASGDDRTRIPVSGIGPQLGSIDLEYTFPRPTVRRGKRYDRVSVAGLEAWGPTGAPALPRRVARVLLPPGAAVERVDVEVSPALRVADGCRLEPTQPLHRPNEDAIPAAAPPDSRIYKSHEPYPSRPWRRVGVGRKHGRDVLLVELTPVVYTPAAERLDYFPAMHLRVHVRGPEHTRAGTRSTVRNVPAELRFTVDNPPPRESRAPPPMGGAAGGMPSIKYAIVTSAELAPAFEPLAAARTAAGLPAAIFTTESIFAGYDGTRPDGSEDNATRLRNFVKHYYENFGLRFLLLGGDADGTTDCNECEPVIVPTRYLRAFSTTPIASDAYFGCLDGTFDGDADGVYGEPTDGEDGGDVDLMFEVHVGRAPVDTLEEAANFVAKTLAYEPSSGAVLRRVLLAAEFLGFGGHYDWAGGLSDQIRFGSTEFLTTVGFESESSPHRDFLVASTLYDSDALGGSWAPSTLIDVIESGVHLLNHIGHADISNVMKLTNREIDALENNDFFLGYTQSCYAGAFDNRRTDGSFGDDSVVEHFITGPHGAAAFVACSRRGWAGTQTADGPSNRFNRWFWDAVLGGGVLRWGAANDTSREASIAYTQANERARWCFYGLNTFGDPALTIKLSSSRGSLTFDRAHYNPGDTAKILLLDSDLNRTPDDLDRVTLEVDAVKSGDREAIELVETGLASGAFEATVEIGNKPATAGDGVLQAAPPDTLSVAYTDESSSDGGTREVAATARVSARLTFASECPPDSAVGVPFVASYEVEGGLPPYRFAAESGYVESVGGAFFEGLGVPRNWNGDDSFWVYAMPFEFPYYGSFHDSIIVSSNGFLQLGEGNSRDFSNSIEGLITNRRIAPLWADLVTSDDGDVYIEEKFDSVTIRWRGEGYQTRDNINVEVELFADGRIRFGYGSGNNELSPTIGISAGDGLNFVIASISGAEEDLDTMSVNFFPSDLPEGLTVDEESGELRGVPQEVTSVELSVRATDASGQVARQRCVVTVRPDGLRVASPREGDLWLRGSEQTIRWEWFGSFGSNVRIDYNTDGGTTDFPHPLAAELPIADRAFTWVVPETPAGQVRVRITSVEEPEFFTHSGVFSIVDPTLIWRTPRPGDRWIVGEEAVLRWESLGPTGESVRVEYNTDGSTTEFLPLINAAPNTGEFHFVVPDTPSESVRLRITGSASPETAAVLPDPRAAATERLLSIRRPAISVIAPEAGSCLRIGETALVTWASEGDTGGEVVIEYGVGADPDEFAFLVGDGPFPNTGSASWEVPDLPGATLRLRIRSVNVGGVSGVSDPFTLEYVCTLRTLFWVPFIETDEEQTVGAAAALRRFEPDVEISFSVSTTDSTLREDLAGKDTVVIIRQKRARGDGAGELGNELRDAFGEFVERGRSLIVCQQPEEFEPFLAAAGLFEIQYRGTHLGLLEIAQPPHPIVTGVRPNFSAPLNTVWVDLQNRDTSDVVVNSDQITVAASRDVGFGRLTFLGFDYYSFHNDSARLLANAARRSLVADGIRLVAPRDGAVAFAGESMTVEWVARGDGLGPARILYNTDGDADNFPELAAEATPEEDRGNFVWNLPDIPPGKTFLRLGLRVQSALAPQQRDTLTTPLYLVRPLHIDPAPLPEGNVGLSYNTTIAVKGGAPPYEFEVAGLPAGLIWQADKDRENALQIVGVPQVPCVGCELAIRVRDSLGATAEQLVAFSVVKREIILRRPNGGEIFLTGSTVDVLWETSGRVGDTVSIRFNRNGSVTDFPETITESAPIDQPFVWELPPINVARARVQVQSNEYPEMVAYSERVFSISGPTIRLEAPNGEECWEPRKPRRIRWQSAGNPGDGVRIEYGAGQPGEGETILIEERAPDTGEYVWPVPSDLDGTYWAQVSFTDAPTIRDASDASFIVQPECSLSTLLWVPCQTGFPAVAPSEIRAALEAHDPNLEWDLYVGDDVEALGHALIEYDTVIVFLSFCRDVQLDSLGAESRALLEAFLNEGGVGVLLLASPTAGQFLRGLGRADQVALLVVQEDLPSRVVAPLHPLVNGVPATFDAPFLSYGYRTAGGDWETVVEAEGIDGITLAAAQEVGAGRLVAVGMDYREYNDASSRLLYNAARYRAKEPGFLLTEPRPEQVFVAGDPVRIKWAAQGDRQGTVRVEFNLDGSETEFPFVAGEVEAGATGGALDWIAPTPKTASPLTCRLRLRWVEEPQLVTPAPHTFFITRERLQIDTDRLAVGFQGAEYHSVVQASGGAPPYIYEVQDLPAGLFPEPPPRPDGPTAIAGIPLVTGTDLRVTLRVGDFLGSVAERVVPIDILPSRLHIVSPADREFLLAGSTHEIRWQITGFAGSSARIEYNLDGSTSNFPHVISESVPLGAPFLWTVPTTVSDRCRLRIQSNDISIATISQRPFSIAPPGITCLFPNGEELVESVTTRTIRWRSLGNPSGRVDIGLNTDGSDVSFPIAIARDVADTGTFAWDVPADLDAETCRIRVRSTTDATLLDVSDGTFQVRYRGAQRGLIWIPFTGFDRAEVRGAIAAVTVFEHDFDWVLSKSLTEAELRRDLTGKETFAMVEQDPAGEVNFRARGRELANALHEFVERGGTVIVLKQRDSANDFLTATELLEAREIGRGFDVACRVAIPDHPITHAVARDFSALAATGWYEVNTPDARAYVTTAAGDPVVVGRDIGDGRVTLIGFDYRDYTLDAARLLANVTRMIAAEPRPHFVRGDANADGQINIADAFKILNYLFLNGAPPPCLDAADVNDSAFGGALRAPIDISDVLWLLNWMFMDTTPPPPPAATRTHPLKDACGPDPQLRDGLDCRAYPVCGA